MLTLGKVISVADAAYGDAAHKIKATHEGKDALAQFIAGELADYFDQDLNDEACLAAMVQALENAERGIARVRHALEKLGG